MNEPAHIPPPMHQINKIKVLLQTNSQYGLQPLMGQLSRQVQRQTAQCLNSWWQQNGQRQTAPIRIDTVQVHVGTCTKGVLARQLATALNTALLKALQTHLPNASVSTAGQSAQQPLPPAGNPQQQAFWYFLHTGTLPWPIKAHKFELKKALAEAIAQGTPAQWQAILQHPQASQRLARLLTEQQWQQLNQRFQLTIPHSLQHTLPGYGQPATVHDNRQEPSLNSETLPPNHPTLQEGQGDFPAHSLPKQPPHQPASNPSVPSNTNASAALPVTPFINRKLPVTNGNSIDGHTAETSPFNPSTSRQREQLRQYSPVEGGKEDDSTHSLPNQNPPQPASNPSVPPNTNASAALSTTVHDVPSNQPTEYYLSHAGLILLWPGLKHLFSTCGLTEANHFANPTAQHRAVVLLHYLGLKALPHEEYDLVLHKVLCGLAPGTPVHPAIELTAHEMQTANAVRAAILQEWTAARQLTEADLMANFVQRAGKLSHSNSSWQLHIERKVWDVLIDTLPWGIGTVHLPWFNQMIYTTW